MTRTVIIGTRGSELALWQARAVQDAVRMALPEVPTEIRVVSTLGDKILDKPLEAIGDKGLFTKELEKALLSGEVDMCVHSMKDMMTTLPEGCVIGAMLPRADVRDALVCGPRIAGASSLADVRAGARIGTGSHRRSSQLRASFPHIQPTPIRGSLETRLAKADGADFEGAILAVAGLERMGFHERIAMRIPVEMMVPAVGQGAIGIEIREGDERIARLCQAIDDEPTSTCVRAERKVLATLEGGCQAPIGAYARFEDGSPLFDAIVCANDGSRRAYVRLETMDADEVIRQLRAQGAEEILAYNQTLESAQ